MIQCTLCVESVDLLRLHDENLLNTGARDVLALAIHKSERKRKPFVYVVVEHICQGRTDSTDNVAAKPQLLTLCS